jgi:catechol 2,3-dioxygenase-like lactoylglutathione lyase family enzyme
MDISIRSTFLPLSDPEASLAFYRDTLTFELRNDVGYNGLRRITVGSKDAVFARVHHEDAEELTDQPQGVRDRAVQEPAGNLLRIQQQKS